MSRSVADPVVGRLLDARYRVGPVIARGGMATVYEATDLRLDRVVALKVMHPDLGDDGDFAGRFVREARSAARLSHPNVVAVFDQGDDDGTLFLAMEYIPGHTLRDVVRKEAPMAASKALAMLDPVLSALAAAHRAGMVHRDVKPENVLIADDGRTKVADFGLARAVTAETQHTRTAGVLIGTVSYLAPELVVAGAADARADVYAVGVLLYEMLTGRKPHQADSPIQVAYKHVHEDVPAPSREVPGIPAYVDALVARATARDATRRPADAQVLLHQVRRVRQALDHGITDDPELTADLSPTVPVHSDELLGSDDPGRSDDPGHSGDTVHPGDPVHAGDPGAPEHTRVVATAAPGRKVRRRRGPSLLALVLLLVAAAGAGAWYLGFGRYTATPGVINLAKAQAADKVAAAGLHFAVGGHSYSERVPAGSVISTDPRPGSRVLDDGTVTAVISKGPERYAVPSLSGMSEDAARAALDKHHLSFGEPVRRFDEDVPVGDVLATDPEVGTELRPDTAVDLVVSKGPRPIEVPDLTGKDAEQAAKTLRRRGFDVQATSRHDDRVPDGDVLAQSPSSGTLFRGDQVRLVVSEGPVMVEVPDVIGAGVDDAVAQLEDAGFEVHTEESTLYVGLHYVVDTDPDAGTLLPRGSVITLSLV